ncbi:hypothetical protein BT96DRAFT_1009384 [Gymnopus androsaceus JB14]|uniref:Uncharacterized protein n=1 Tax=Gymnopus androsaceus JB14 TaxID=1447944 RepID=A0A6A4GCY3_9AGAR|nr:hypothetical protein BT96DRAFT_1009384 [Gymnopus androsaceus JB14]
MPGYCQVKHKVPSQTKPIVMCCFDYPMDLRDTPAIGLTVNNDLNLKPCQNDPIMNTYNPALILAWQANINLKPILSKDAALNYIAKYGSKAEQQAPEFPRLLALVVENNPNPQFLNEEDWQMWARDQPAADIPHFALDHLGERPLITPLNMAVVEQVGTKQF